MLLDFGWSELMLIGVVALVVVGPKDLPKALRIAGYWVRKARTLSREFQNNVEQMIRDAELDEVRDELKKATEFDIDKEFRNTIDPTGELADALHPPELPNLSQSGPASGSDGAAPPAPAAAEPHAIEPMPEPAAAGHAASDHAATEPAAPEPAQAARGEPPPRGPTPP
jgi:sec-independent protein translocase protein TatB